MKFSKRFLALFLSVVLIFSTLPLGASAAGEVITITVVDQDGKAITDATVTANDRLGFGVIDDINNVGDGTYTFTSTSYGDWFGYTVTASKSGYTSQEATIASGANSVTVTLTANTPAVSEYAVTVTVADSSTNSTIDGASVTLNGNTAETSNGTCSLFAENGTYTVTATADGYKEGSAAVTVEDNDTSVTVYLDPEEQYITFEIFYIANGDFPDSYTAGGEAANYGPSGNDVPLVLLEVNITALKSEKYSDVVSFSQEDGSNNWHFIPTVTNGDKDAAEAFWAAVVECSTAESIAAFEETGLFDSFVGYCLKSQGSAGDDYHGDGILNVVPPVYVIELYKNHVYVGGSVTDATTELKNMVEVLASLEHYLNQNITWNEDENGNPVAVDNVYTGTYIADHVLYTIEVSQTDLDAAQTIEGSEIPYEKKTDQYYLATFDIYETGTPLAVEYTITYTDGADGTVFYNHEYGVDEGTQVHAFTGSNFRVGYMFRGWLLDTDGQLYTDAEIANLTATSDMTFTAQWEQAFTVTFHTNHPDLEQSVFRTYYQSGADLPEGSYHLAANGTIPKSFYDIPEFDDDATHNQYIFKGWYRYENNDTSTDPIAISWEDLYQSNTHIYAQWIEVTSVTQEAADEKQNVPGGSYAGFDLAGTQIRYTETQEDPWYDYSQDQTGPGSGLRFIGVLSTQVENALRDTNAANASGIAYGFAIAKSATTAKYAGSTEGYQLHIPDANVNGVDTRTAYKYSKNILCSGLSRDHYNGEGYRLYTAVVTFKNGTGYDIDFLTRSYLRYYDANGLYRTYYNNYTGDSAVYSGCSASYDDVKVLVQQITGA